MELIVIAGLLLGVAVIGADRWFRSLQLNRHEEIMRERGE